MEEEPTCQTTSDVLVYFFGMLKIFKKKSEVEIEKVWKAVLTDPAGVTAARHVKCLID